MIKWSAEYINSDKGKSKNWYLGFSLGQLGKWPPFVKIGTVSGRADLGEILVSTLGCERPTEIPKSGIE